MKVDERTGWPMGAPPAATFCAEDDRIAVLASHGLDALAEDPELTAIAAFAAKLCRTPMSFVSIVGSEEQRFIAREGSELEGTPRSQSFCAHAMLGAAPLEVPDATRDPRFADNPLVTGEQHIRFYAGAPLISEEGAPLGALCVIDSEPRPGGLDELQREGLQVLAQAVMRRLKARRAVLAAEKELHLSEERFRLLADTMPDIAFATGPDGRADYYNRRWYEFSGVGEDFAGHDRGELVHDEDREQAIASWRKSRETGEPYEAENRLRRHDGEYRWMLVRALPLKDEDGKVVRWFGTMTDIDKGHRLSENRDLLARELSHRIKNIFAVVAGLISIRARKRPELAEFADELNGTIRALGRAHDFVRPIEGEKGDSLRGLMGELMAPYGDGSNQVSIGGDDCAIGPRAATPLALVFHELATNSAKYGALSVDNGRVEIVIDCPETDGIARIGWRESGGPDVVEEISEGFGSRLVRMAVEGQLGGQITRRFYPGGLEVDLTIPIGAIRS